MDQSDKDWILKIVSLALEKLPEACLNKALDANTTGTLDLHGGLLSIRTTVQNST